MSIKNVSSSNSTEVNRNIKQTNKYLTITDVAKFALSFLAIVSLIGVITSAVLFFHMGIGVACIAFIVSSVTLGVFSLSLLYPAIKDKLPSPILYIGDNVAALAKELFSVFITFGVVTYGMFAKNKDPTNQGETPILLIHGYGMNSGHFAYVRYCLKKNGLGPIYSINLSPFSSIDSYANQVSAKVEQINSSHSGKVTLIGHSMGGVVAARYLANCKKTDRIEQLITLGSPLQGTYTSYLGPGKCAEEMRPHSSFLKKLENDLAHVDIPITTVESKCDLIILPNKNASFKAVPADIRTFRSMGHNNYLFSDGIIKLLLSKISCN